jgi:hypothetical protein
MTSAGPVRPLDTAAFQNYFRDDAYDEMFDEQGSVRRQYIPLTESFLSLSPEDLRRRKQSADLAFLNQSGDHLYGLWAGGRHRADFPA